jgi:hypothetical protein
LILEDPTENATKAEVVSERRTIEEEERGSKGKIDGVRTEIYNIS